MRNLLFVSVAFPPKNDPECLQTAKYYRYLVKDERLAISVVTSKIPTLFMPYDPHLDAYNTGYVQQIQLPVFETKLTNFALRKILPGGIDYPDSKFTFHWQQRKVIRKLKQKPDVIYSRSFPMSSALLAYKLKQHYDVPWIMHLSDPWVGSPVHHYHGRQLRYQQQWQDKCFEAADFIGLTSLSTIQFYKTRYPQYAHKFVFFPNVYDPTDVRDIPMDFNTKLRIVYTGGLAGKRSPRNFIAACERVRQEDPRFFDAVEVIFAGPMDSENRAVFEQNQNPAIRHVGSLSYVDALELIKTSHALLTIDLPIQDPAMAMFFPSKILDYFLVNRRILALTSEGSATSQVLQDFNTTILRHDDVDGICQALVDMRTHFQQQQADYFTIGKIPQEYSASYNATRLADLINTL
jgi:glycosyltransferase involved in cell wall biosynthesis